MLFGCYVAIQLDVVHSGIYRFEGSTCFYMLIWLKNYKHGLDQLTQLKNQSIETKVECRMMYSSMMQKVNAFSKFYTNDFWNVIPHWTPQSFLIILAIWTSMIMEQDQIIPNQIFSDHFNDTIYIVICHTQYNWWFIKPVRYYY